MTLKIDFDLILVILRIISKKWRRKKKGTRNYDNGNGKIFYWLQTMTNQLRMMSLVVKEEKKTNN